MNTDYRVSDLVPHSGLMSLLDCIVDYGEDWLEAEVLITRQSLFANENGVPAWVGMEYMAQAVAAFAGTQERRKGEKPKLGFLVGTRKYTCSTDNFPFHQTLSLRVERELETADGLNVFQCELSGGEIEAHARLNVYQPDDAEKFLQETTP